jgi:uncharacterized protein YoxC
VETVLLVAQILSSVCVAILCVYLIIVLIRVREVLASVERDLKDMTSKAIPILDNMEFITSRVKSITESIDDQVIVVRESIGSLRQVAENIVELERRVQERIEGPILDSVAFIAAVFKGVRTFVERVRA